MEMYKNIHLSPCYFVIQPGKSFFILACRKPFYPNSACLALACFEPVSSYANNHHCPYCPGMPYWLLLFPSVLPSYQPALSLLPQSPKDGLSQPESVVLSVFGYLLNKVILPIHKKRWLFRHVRHARYGRCGAHKFPIYWATHS